jgi:hypothetical protein
VTTSEEAAFLPRNVVARDQAAAAEAASRARRVPARTIRRQPRPTPARPPTPKAPPNKAVEPDGPHVRLGVAWALVTLAALLGGPVWVALWMAPAAALAAGSSQRSWQDRPGRPGRLYAVQPPVVLAAGAAGLITLVSAAGPVPTIAVSTVVALAIVAAAKLGPRDVPAVAPRLLIVLLPGAGAAGLVLSRARGLPAGLVLAGMVCAYDSAAYLIGTDAKSRWEGPVAGLASVAALTVLVAAVLAPPFRGSSPWILGGLAAILAPLGQIVARRLIRDPAARVPALRRLDSLLLLGPAWAVGTVLLAHP